MAGGRKLLIVDHGVEQVIRADRHEWVPVFTGLSEGQSQEFVAGRGVNSRVLADGGVGRWLTGCC